MNSPHQFYQKSLTAQKEKLAKLKQKKSAFAWLRLGAIAAIILSLYWLWSVGPVYAIIVAAVVAFIFVRLIYADLNNQELIDHTKKLIAINEEEINELNGDKINRDDGNKHKPADHAYANDLDIFGPASVFQFINRTTSEGGSRHLAEMLLSPAGIDEIYLRQEAVKELSADIHWIQDAQATGRANALTGDTRKRLEKWMAEPPIFLTFKHWRWLRYLLPLIICSVVAGYFMGNLSEGLLYFTLLIFAVIAYQVNKYVSPVHEKLSKMAGEMNTLSRTIRLVESHTFTSKLLLDMQQNYTAGNGNASLSIYRLKKILDRLDLRYNLVLSAPLNLLLLWNLQQVLALEKWKAGKKNTVGLWFDAVSTLEALNSFAVLHFNRPSWIFPTVKDDYFSIEGAGIGHPLIPENKRVDNDIDIRSRDQLMLVTGSNMAGKSTYLRSIGVNTVLALAGAPVCADSFILSHVYLISSMRVTDNLEESTSTFYAELKKLKTIIEKVNAGEKVFILLDEILRGTNSLDRHLGSKALIRQLIQKKAAAIIATHDLELAQLKDEYIENILNYHFDVQVSNAELYFDYRLKPGICTSLNASILMKKIGIDL